MFRCWFFRVNPEKGSGPLVASRFYSFFASPERVSPLFRIATLRNLNWELLIPLPRLR